MQSNSGKRRSCQRTRKSRVSAYACLSLILLYSCSSFQSQGPSYSLKGLETQNQISKKVCLDSFGKGRLSFGTQSSRFTYESVVDEDWFRLGIDVPFKPQEDLLFPMHKNAKIGGSLYSKLLKNYQSDYKSILLFNKFITESSLIFRVIKQGPIKSCDDGVCLKGEFSKVDGYPRYKIGLDKKHFLTVHFKREKNYRYNSIQLSAYRAVPNGPEKFLGLDLAISSCQ